MTVLKNCALVVVAAGRGTRLGRGQPKAMVEVRGRPLLAWTLRSLARWQGWEQWCVVLPAGAEAWFRTHIRPEIPLDLPCHIVLGGERRQDSVLAGLTGLKGMEPHSPVMVHDAARPMVSRELIERLWRAHQDGGAAVIPVLPVPDTVKTLGDDGRWRTVERDRLRLAQTPQLAPYGILVQALREAAARKVIVTDEAQALERIRFPVHTVVGDPWNRKITHTEDLNWLAWALTAREKTSPPESGAAPTFPHD